MLYKILFVPSINIRILKRKVKNERFLTTTDNVHYHNCRAIAVTIRINRLPRGVV